jgi:Ca2+-binding EF-hand superfamily protein
MRLIVLAGGLTLMMAVTASGQEKEKSAPKKPLPPALRELLQGTPAEFVKRFDKDGDGMLSKTELPPFLTKGFDRADRNGDGKLDREEVAGLLTTLRQVMSAGPPARLGATPDEVIATLLKQFDTNRDGKLARDEVKGRLAENFARVDQNKDDFLDRKELRVMAERLLATRKLQGGGPAAVADFDALDKNADGRLSRDELRGTPWLSRFAEIDADRSGGLDRREFESFLARQAKKDAK